MVPARIMLADAPTDSLLVHYIGCGGFLLKKGKHALLVDPYFSNLGPWALLPFKRLRPDTTLIDQFFQKHFKHNIDLQGSIEALLISHAHYDHLADVPSIYQRNFNQQKPKIFGSQTTKHLLQGASIPEKKEDLTILNEIAWEPGKEMNWIYLPSQRIKILPIKSEHAPHLMGRKLAPKGSLDQDKKKFPRKPLKMPEGMNFNFLIDFLDENGAIEFRVFSQAGSASNYPKGSPPKALLEEKKVDLLLLCIASYSQVKGYPKDIITAVNPRSIIFTHWENFAVSIPKLKKKPRVVPLTDVKEFLDKNEIYFPKNKWKLPNVDIPIMVAF